ncbi:MAG TPA: S8 family serine peptidase [Vicinamibacterales bacterium]|nr:S8 family serine peptidase [Vicinamibacterales bacterium]
MAGATLAIVVMCGFQWPSEHHEDERVTTRVNGAEAVEGEVLVKYRDGRHGLHLIRSTSLRTSELLSRLAQDRAVEFAEPNYMVRLLSAPNDPSFSSLWGLFNSGFNSVGGGGVAGSDIDAPAAWDITTGSRKNVIGVMDTGIDYTHLDLAANVWSAPASFQVTIGGVTISCAAGTHGFNAVARNCDPMDDHAHGTHVAGTIGARGNNTLGVSGVNWTASMMAIKVLGASGSGTVADVVAGLEFAVQAKAVFAATSAANVRVLSNSWASSAPSTALRAAIDAAGNADMLVVTAAGNNGTNNDTVPVYPASYALPNLVAVASSTSSDQRSPFSNVGATSVQLAAPGSAILSTAPGNAYAVSQGTSMATAHVSGAALLTLSMCSVTTPELRSLLLGSVDPVPAFSGITATGGRLNVRRMVQNCPRPLVTSLTLTPGVPAPRGLGTTVTWTAVAGGGQGPYQYRFSVWDGAVWSLAQNWSPSNTFAWTPGLANEKYKVAVHVRSSWATQGYDMGVAEPFAIGVPASSVTLTSDLAAPQAAGTPVTWTASASGGQAPYTYRFIVWDGATWTEGRAWGASNVFTWTPPVANLSYKVAVLVRSAWNTGPNEISLSKPFAIQPAVTNLTLSPVLASPQSVGTPVDFTASASGGQAPYEYLFAVYDGVTWTTKQGWSSSASFRWVPTAAYANYRVLAKARSAWNKGAAERQTEVSFAIRASVTAATLTPSLTSPRPDGTTVRWTASASGGQPPYQYRFVVFDGSVWTEMTDWTTSNTFDWTPFGPSDRYQVAVRVRSAGNTGTAEFTAFQNYVITRVALTAARVMFEPSAPGETVDHYRFDVFAGGANPNVATPIATQNLGRPAQPCTECSADVSSTLLPLPEGYYLATVAAVGPGATYRSEAFRFIR